MNIKWRVPGSENNFPSGNTALIYLYCVLQQLHSLDWANELFMFYKDHSVAKNQLSGQKTSSVSNSSFQFLRSGVEKNVIHKWNCTGISLIWKNVTPDFGNCWGYWSKYPHSFEKRNENFNGGPASNLSKFASSSGTALLLSSVLMQILFPS